MQLIRQAYRLRRDTSPSMLPDPEPLRPLHAEVGHYPVFNAFPRAAVQAQVRDWGAPYNQCQEAPDGHRPLLSCATQLIWWPWCVLKCQSSHSLVYQTAGQQSNTLTLPCCLLQSADRERIAAQEAALVRRRRIVADLELRSNALAQQEKALARVGKQVQYELQQQPCGWRSRQRQLDSICLVTGGRCGTPGS